MSGPRESLRGGIPAGAGAFISGDEDNDSTAIEVAADPRIHTISYPPSPSEESRDSNPVVIDLDDIESSINRALNSRGPIDSRDIKLPFPSFAMADNLPPEVLSNILNIKSRCPERHQKASRAAAQQAVEAGQVDQIDDLAVGIMPIYDHAEEVQGIEVVGFIGPHNIHILKRAAVYNRRLREQAIEPCRGCCVSVAHLGVASCSVERFLYDEYLARHEARAAWSYDDLINSLIGGGEGSKPVQYRMPESFHPRDEIMRHMRIVIKGPLEESTGNANYRNIDLSGLEIGHLEIDATQGAIRNLDLTGAKIGTLTVRGELLNAKFDRAEIGRGIFIESNLRDVSFKGVRCKEGLRFVDTVENGGCDFNVHKGTAIFTQGATNVPKKYGRFKSEEEYLSEERIISFEAPDFRSFETRSCATEFARALREQFDSERLLQHRMVVADEEEEGSLPGFSEATDESFDSTTAAAVSTPATRRIAAAADNAPQPPASIPLVAATSRSSQPPAAALAPVAAVPSEPQLMAVALPPAAALEPVAAVRVAPPEPMLSPTSARSFHRVGPRSPGLRSSAALRSRASPERELEIRAESIRMLYHIEDHRVPVISIRDIRVLELYSELRRAGRGKVSIENRGAHYTEQDVRAAQRSFRSFIKHLIQTKNALREYRGFLDEDNLDPIITLTELGSLEGVDGEHLNLDNCDFSFCSLEGLVVDGEKVSMRSVNFEGANLSNIRFYNVDLIWFRVSPETIKTNVIPKQHKERCNIKGVWVITDAGLKNPPNYGPLARNHNIQPRIVGIDPETEGLRVFDITSPSLRVEAEIRSGAGTASRVLGGAVAATSSAATGIGFLSSIVVYYGASTIIERQLRSFAHEYPWLGRLMQQLHGTQAHCLSDLFKLVDSAMPDSPRKPPQMRTYEQILDDVKVEMENGNFRPGLAIAQSRADEVRGEKILGLFLSSVVGVSVLASGRGLVGGLAAASISYLASRVTMSGVRYASRQARGTFDTRNEFGDFLRYIGIVWGEVVSIEFARGLLSILIANNLIKDSTVRAAFGASGVLTVAGASTTAFLLRNRLSAQPKENEQKIKSLVTYLERNKVYAGASYIFLMTAAGTGVMYGFAAAAGLTMSAPVWMGAIVVFGGISSAVTYRYINDINRFVSPVIDWVRGGISYLRFMCSTQTKEEIIRKKADELFAEQNKILLEEVIGVMENVSYRAKYGMPIPSYVSQILRQYLRIVDRLDDTNLANKVRMIIRGGLRTRAEDLVVATARTGADSDVEEQNYSFGQVATGVWNGATEVASRAAVGVRDAAYDWVSWAASPVTNWWYGEPVPQIEAAAQPAEGATAPRIAVAGAGDNREIDSEDSDSDIESGWSSNDSGIEGDESGSEDSSEASNSTLTDDEESEADPIHSLPPAPAERSNLEHYSAVSLPQKTPEETEREIDELRRMMEGWSGAEQYAADEADSRTETALPPAPPPVPEGGGGAREPYTVGRVRVVHDNLLLDSVEGAELLNLAAERQGAVGVGLLLELGRDPEIAAQLLAAARREGGKWVMDLLLNVQFEYPDHDKPVPLLEDNESKNTEATKLTHYISPASSLDDNSVLVPLLIIGATIVKFVESKEAFRYMLSEVIPINTGISFIIGPYNAGHIDEEKQQEQSEDKDIELYDKGRGGLSDFISEHGVWSGLHLVGGLAISFSFSNEDVSLTKKILAPASSTSLYALRHVVHSESCAMNILTSAALGGFSALPYSVMTGSPMPAIYGGVQAASISAIGCLGSNDNESGYIGSTAATIVTIGSVVYSYQQGALTLTFTTAKGILSSISKIASTASVASLVHKTTKITTDKIAYVIEVGYTLPDAIEVVTNSIYNSAKSTADTVYGATKATTNAAMEAVYYWWGSNNEEQQTSIAGEVDAQHL